MLGWWMKPADLCPPQYPPQILYLNHNARRAARNQFQNPFHIQAVKLWSLIEVM